MSDEENPYVPPESPPAQTTSLNGGTKAPLPLRVLFGMLAVGFAYSIGFLKFQPGQFSFAAGFLLLVLIVFECLHVAIMGTWYVPRLSGSVERRPVD